MLLSAARYLLILERKAQGMDYARIKFLQNEAIHETFSLNSVEAFKLRTLYTAFKVEVLAKGHKAQMARMAL